MAGPVSKNAMNYALVSGSGYTSIFSAQDASRNGGMHLGGLNFQDTIISSSAGQTCSALYTYYQRVFDETFTFWCYYSGSSINESPGATDTTPHNSGNISGYSIISVTNQIVCS